MEYQEAREQIAAYNGGYHFELDRIKEMLRRLDHPDRGQKIIHVAGTNGKGSVAAFLSGMLREAGYHVGTFFSPAVFHYREQFAVDQEPITRQMYTACAEKVLTCMEEMAKDGWEMPSPFERETVIALLFFQKRECDYVILECGLGGEKDATNAVSSCVLAVFASISLDHTMYLGKTVEEIARAKAGIIKPGCTAVSGRQLSSVLTVLKHCAQEKHVPFLYADPGKVQIRQTDISGTSFFWRNRTWEIHLPGLCQVDNAMTAVLAAQVILADQKIIQGRDAEEVLATGLEKTRWAGRFTRISEHPDFVVDGAHNPGAARRLSESLKTYYPDRKIIFILGVFSDKDYTQVLEETLPEAAYVFTIETPDNPRALKAEELAACVKKYGCGAEACGSAREAVEKAIMLAGKDGVVVSFGSLSNIAEITAIVRKKELT